MERSAVTGKCGQQIIVGSRPPSGCVARKGDWQIVLTETLTLSKMLVSCVFLLCPWQK
jgi:hypothetical protein